MALSHLLEFEAFSSLHYGQLTTINGHYPEVTQSDHIYDNRYNPRLYYYSIRLQQAFYLLLIFKIQKYAQQDDR